MCTRLPVRLSNRFPVLQGCTSAGLPAEVKWSTSHGGPEFEFAFQLEHSTFLEAPTNLAKAIEKFLGNTGHLLRIGTYFYRNDDVVQQTGVYVQAEDGALWLLELNRPTLHLIRESDLNSAEQLPFFHQLLNTHYSQFEPCIMAYTLMWSQFREQKVRLSESRTLWANLEETICQIDPGCLSVSTSFWSDAIGAGLQPDV